MKPTPNERSKQIVLIIAAGVKTSGEIKGIGQHRWGNSSGPKLASQAKAIGGGLSLSVAAGMTPKQMIEWLQVVYKLPDLVIPTDKLSSVEFDNAGEIALEMSRVVALSYDATPVSAQQKSNASDAAHRDRMVASDVLRELFDLARICDGNPMLFKRALQVIVRVPGQTDNPSRTLEELITFPTEYNADLLARVDLANVLRPAPKAEVARIGQSLDSLPGS